MLIIASSNVRAMLNRLRDIIKANKMLMKNSFVQELVSMIEQLMKETEELKAEIRRLKTHPAKPVIKPSTLEKPQKNTGAADSGTETDNTRPKCSKKPYLKIDREEKIELKEVPAGGCV
jgi:hypothetical protein